MNEQEVIINLYRKTFGYIPEKIEALPNSGSSRKYFRLYSGNETIIGAYNDNRQENEAFIQFTKFFIKHGLHVPKVISENLDENVYLLSDLGDTTLYTYLQENRKGEDFPENVVTLYKKALLYLIKFQFIDNLDFPYNYCYQGERFNKQSMLWDLNYFKYYFLRLIGIPFDEGKLEEDFQVFTDYLSEAESEYFMFRDFQSRNIMLYNDNLYFIDYQSGRRGPLQYDLASILYDAKADLPQEIRNNLLEFYVENLSLHYKIDRESFLKYFYGYVLIRIMQAMGAYGFRGIYERKELFLQSIPYALKNIDWILKNVEFDIKFKTLDNLLRKLVDFEKLKKIYSPKLTVNIYSFSYKNGIPEDKAGNGGGFVFDCRAIPNPGRYEEFIDKSGRDEEVINFMEKYSDTWEFFNNTSRIVENTIINFQKRGFTNLFVAYGCTGGQHRSVYFAQKLYDFLKTKYDVKLVLNHRELSIIEKN